MTALFWALRNWRLLLLGGLVVFLGIFKIRVDALNRSLRSARQRADELEAYKSTRRKLDEVDKSLGDDPDAARGYLQRRKEPKPPGPVRRNGGGS